MVSWSARGQAKYGGVFLLILLILFILVYFLYFYKPESCFDGKLNQDEVTIDCGGACEMQCALGDSVVVEWSRLLIREQGAIDVAALVRNPNINLESEVLSYTFSIYDKNNLLIRERSGETSIDKQETLLIFERDIVVGERAPHRVFIEVKEKAPWKKSLEEESGLSVQKRVFLPKEEAPGGLPRLGALLVNDSFTLRENIQLTALVYDTEGTIASVATTFVKEITGEGSQEISFIFPHSVPETPGRIEVLIRVLGQ